MTRLKFTSLKLTTPKLLGAAAILATALAGPNLVSPAMAQQVIYNPGYCAQFYPNANCQNTGPGNPYTGDYQRRTANGYHQGWNNDWRQSRNDDALAWPGDVAAAAVGTAGAIATAPFRAGNAYAYDGGSYASRNGFVCEPGSFFRGEDGLRHRCQ